MDKSHHGLLDELAELLNSPDDEIARSYASLVAAIERDFREEEDLMEEVGLDSFQPHVEQHARMLSALHHSLSQVMQGNIDAGRAALQLLPEWLQFHIGTLDPALANAVLAHLGKRASA